MSRIYVIHCSDVPYDVGLSAVRNDSGTQIHRSRLGKPVLYDPKRLSKTSRRENEEAGNVGYRVAFDISRARHPNLLQRARKRLRGR